MDVPLPLANKFWHNEWFYCDNPPPSLPNFVGKKAESHESWSKKSNPNNEPIRELQKKIAELKKKGIDGVTMSCSFIARRVQPIKELVHPGWEYSTGDSTKEVPDPPSLTLTIFRLSRLFKGALSELRKGIKEAYSHGTARSKMTMRGEPMASSLLK